MLFLCVIVHTMWSGKSLMLLCILPFGMLCLSSISMLFVKKYVGNDFAYCQRVECAVTSPVRAASSMYLMNCMQWCMSGSAVL